MCRRSSLFILRLLFGIAAAIILAVVILFMQCSSLGWDYRDLDALEKWIRENETVLAQHTLDVVEKKVAKNEGKVSYPPPALPPSGPGVIYVTKDRNDNVYFITAGSFVTFNTGFVYSVQDKKLLGDQTEPRITFQQHLFGRWWAYTAQ